jgi:glycosyltransferase involved in cell wall biosynthesis
MTATPAVKTILFATEYYRPFMQSGAEWTKELWAGALARRGHRVVVVTPNYGAAARDEADGVAVYRVPFPLRLRRGSEGAGWLVHRNLLFHLYFGWQVARIAGREHADLIHVQNTGSLVGGWLAARWRRLPIVMTVRDLGPLCPLGMCTLFEPWTTFDCSTTQYLGKCVPFFLRQYVPGTRGVRRLALRARLLLGWIDQQLRNRALRGLDGVIGISAGVLVPFPDRLIPSARRRVVHSPIPRTTPPDDTEASRTRRELGIGPGPLVLYAGKRSLGKGTPVLLQSLDTIRAAVPGVQFAFAGRGEEPLPAKPDVHALGPLPQPTLFRLYRAADVVVSPSIWPEPLSRVILESMWAGRPVVATAVGGSPEAVEHGTTGLLVPRNDAPALAEAVAELLHDPDRRARMGKAAAARAAAMFGEDHVVPQLLAAYESLAARSA